MIEETDAGLRLLSFMVSISYENLIVYFLRRLVLVLLKLNSRYIQVLFFLNTYTSSILEVYKCARPQRLLQCHSSNRMIYIVKNKTLVIRYRNQIVRGESKEQ